MPAFIRQTVGLLGTVLVIVLVLTLLGKIG